MSGSGRPKILGVGFATPGFGFGRVFGSLYPRLHARWEIEHLEFSPRHAGSDQVPWPLRFTRRPGFHFGHLEFAELLDQCRPDIVLFSLDVWQLPPYLKALAQAQCAPRTVAYCPVDAPLPLNLSLAELAALDALVVPTNFGRNEVAVALARHGVALTRDVAVIPHGVDTSRFFPLPDPMGASAAQRARAALFPGQTLDQAFIVLNANRNQRRKRLDLTMQGFAAFARDKPADVRLLLHSGTIDLGSSTVAMAHDLGVLDRVLWTRHGAAHPVVDDATLNVVYNACQVGLNTCTSEGWGLLAFEHAAAGAAQVVPEHSACGELWRDAATLLPATPYVAANGAAAGGEVTACAVACALERLYQDPDHLAEHSRRALANAHRPELQWDAVAGRFEALFLDLIK